MTTGDGGALRQDASATRTFPVASWLISAQQSRAHPRLLSLRARGRRRRRSPHAAAGSASSRCSTVSTTALRGRGAPIRTPSRCGSLSMSAASSPRHALDLLDAFRLDVRKNSLCDWQELMDYCRLSAMPVGRFVLDVHGEDRIAVAGVRRALRRASGDQPSPGLRRGLSQSRSRLSAARHPRRAWRLGRDAGRAERAPRRCARPSPSSPRARPRLDPARRERSSPQITDFRLAAEIAAIQALARRLARDLESRDPLSERVHLGKAGFACGRRARRAARSSPRALIRSVRARPKARRMSARQAAPAARSSFYMAMRILPSAAARGDVRALRVLPRGRRHRRRARAGDAGRSALAELDALARRHRRALCRAARRRISPRSTEAVRASA